MVGVTLKLKSFLDIGSKEYTDWYVIFLESKHRYWWTPWLKDGFTHCYAVRYTLHGWLYFNQAIGYSEVDMLLARTTNPHKIEPAATKIVRVRTWRDQKQRVPQIFQACTCVEGVKSILGVKSFITWTPWQFYKYLMKSNSELFTVQEI